MPNCDGSSRGIKLAASGHQPCLHTWWSCRRRPSTLTGKVRPARIGVAVSFLPSPARDDHLGQRRPSVLREFEWPTRRSPCLVPKPLRRRSPRLRRRSRWRSATRRGSLREVRRRPSSRRCRCRRRSRRTSHLRRSRCPCRRACHRRAVCPPRCRHRAPWGRRAQAWRRLPRRERRRPPRRFRPLPTRRCRTSSGRWGRTSTPFAG
jgi:hypothetical protein